MPTAPEVRVSDAVAAAWHGHPYSDRIAIPVGTVAAMTLLQTDTVATRDTIIRRWAECTDDELVANIRDVWRALWIIRPRLAGLALPLHGWITSEDPDSETIGGTRAVATAALRAGLLDITGHADPSRRDGADVIGTVLTHLRAPGDTQARGEHHTPADVAAVLNRITMQELPPPGAAFNDCAGGTGGLFRETARRIRALGGDPADYLWAMTDLDRLAVAGAAVNAYLWGLAGPLGRNILIHHGDTLTDPGLERAAAAQAEAFRQHATAVRAARLLAATHGAEALRLHHSRSTDDTAA